MLCVISVRNLSGVDRNRFEVLGIDKPIVEPGENLETFKRSAGLQWCFAHDSKTCGRTLGGFSSGRPLLGP